MATSIVKKLRNREDELMLAKDSLEMRSKELKKVNKKLREADRLLGQGKTVEEVCKEIDVTDATYYRWRKKYGGMSPDMIKQLRAVQKQNAQLKRLLAEAELDKAILREAASGNF